MERLESDGEERERIWLGLQEEYGYAPEHTLFAPRLAPAGPGAAVRWHREAARAQEKRRVLSRFCVYIL